MGFPWYRVHIIVLNDHGEAHYPSFAIALGYIGRNQPHRGGEGDIAL